MSFKSIKRINDKVVMKCPTNQKELQLLFGEIDNFCKIDLPAKLDGLDKTSIQGKCPKTNEELNDLFHDIDNFLKIDLPCKLSGLDDILPCERCPKTKNEVKILFHKIDDLCKINLPSKLDGLENIPIVNVKEKKKYPKTKEELNSLFNEIDSFCRIKIPFKLGDLHEEDNLLDSQQNKKDDFKPIKSTIPSSRKINVRKKQTVDVIANNKSQNQHFKLKIVENRPDDRPIAITKPKPTAKTKIKNVKLPKKRKKVPQSISPDSTLSLKNLFDTKNNVQSRMIFFKEYLSNIKQQYSTDKYRRKKFTQSKELFDSGYSSSSPCSLSIPSSPASSISSSEETCTMKSIKSCSTFSTNSLSSTYSLISRNNPNGKTVYLQDQYEKFIEKRTKRSRNLKYEQNSKKLKTSQPEIDNKIIEWSSKTFTDCPSTPKYDRFENETPPQTPSCFIDNQILDLECLNDSILIDDFPATTKQSSSFNPEQISEFDDWLRENSTNLLLI